jgi:hypothetical protein
MFTSHSDERERKVAFDLLQELENVVTELTEQNRKETQSSHSNHNNKAQTFVFDHTHSTVERLCFVVEKCFLHGLREGFFSRLTIWDYVSQLPDCLPGGNTPVNIVKYVFLMKNKHIIETINEKEENRSDTRA